AGFLVREGDTCSAGEIGPQFPARRVEGRASNLGSSISGGYLKGALMPEHQVQETIMGDKCPLWPPRGPGSIDDVDQVIGCNRFRKVLCALLCQHRCISIQADDLSMLHR